MVPFFELLYHAIHSCRMIRHLCTALINIALYLRVFIPKLLPAELRQSLFVGKTMVGEYHIRILKDSTFGLTSFNKNDKYWKNIQHLLCCRSCFFLSPRSKAGKSDKNPGILSSRRCSICQLSGRQDRSIAFTILIYDMKQRVVHS